MRKKSVPPAIVTLILLTLSIPAATAQPPMPPCWFYGTVSIEGSPAQENLNVTAAIIGSKLTWTTKTKNGTYGWTQKGSTSFYIPSDDPTTPSKDGGLAGDIIEFYLNGTRTKQTAIFEHMSMKRVDLTVGANQPPSTVVLRVPTEIGDDSVELEWSRSPDEDFARYEIYKSTSSETYGTSIQVIAHKQNTNFTVTELLSNTTYFFAIKVVDTENLYTYSNQVQAKTTASSTSSTHGPPWTLLTVVALFIAVALGSGIILYHRREKSN